MKFNVYNVLVAIVFAFMVLIVIGLGLRIWDTIFDTDLLVGYLDFLNPRN